jgi:hypothetical protein
MKEDREEEGAGEVGPHSCGTSERWPPPPRLPLPGSESSGGTGFYRNTPAIADKESFRRLITSLAAPPRPARNNPSVEP